MDVAARAIGVRDERARLATTSPITVAVDAAGDVMS
jgi:hypothetical protein